MHGRFLSARGTGLLAAVLTAACGGGGGASAPAAPPPPPPSVVLTVGAVEAERVALSWVVDDLYIGQAYAIAVDGMPYDLSRFRSYRFDALPDRRYCFTVVVGSLIGALGRFSAEGPTSNEVCIRTPSLPTLESGWTVEDARLGGGGYPSLSRRGPPGTAMAACDARPLTLFDFGSAQSVLRIRADGVVGIPEHPLTGDACAVAALESTFFGFAPVEVLARDRATLTYSRASWAANLGWLSNTEQTVAPDADMTAVSIALGPSGAPQFLYRRAGAAYWAKRGSDGAVSPPERVGDGVVGWRSLAVTADGTSYALIALDSRIVVLRRDPSGTWATVFSAQDAQQPTTGRGTGSIVAPRSGGIRVAYARAGGGSTTGIGYVEWPGGDAPWTVTVVDPATYVAVPAVAVDPSGAPLIAYGGTGDDLRLARRVDGAWHTVFVDALGALARRTDVEVDHDGTVHVLYSDEKGPTRWARRAPP